MAAIATITHPDGSKALVFYNTAEKTIGLQIRDGVLATDDDSNELSTDSVTSTYQDSDTTVTGLVNNPTSLACLYLNASDTKLVGVYGIIKESTSKTCTCQASCKGQLACTVDYGRLALLSPVMMPLDDGTLKVNVQYGRLAASQVPGTKNSGQLYYRSTTATAKISVFNLDDKTSKELADANDPGTATYLAAYYDSVRNCYHVLYQKQATADKKKIYDFQDSKTTALTDVGVTNAHHPAGIAAVYVKSKSSAYLYYVAESGSSFHLWRAIRKDGSWGAHKKVGTDSDPQQTTQISATVMDGKNYVVFTNDEGNLETVQDSW